MKTYIVEYRLAGLSYRIAVGATEDTKDVAISEGMELARSLIDAAATSAKTTITVTVSPEEDKT